MAFKETVPWRPAIIPTTVPLEILQACRVKDGFKADYFFENAEFVSSGRGAKSGTLYVHPAWVTRLREGARNVLKEHSIKITRLHQKKVEDIELARQKLRD